MRAINSKVLAVVAALVASSVAALAANTTFFTSIGDLPFPFTAPQNSGATPGAIDNMVIGASTPEAGTFSKLAVKQAGTFTLNGATPVTVAAAGVTANSQVLITLKTVGGAVGAQPHVETITVGTGFTVVGTASDTSVYNYAILN